MLNDVKQRQTWWAATAATIAALAVLTAATSALAHDQGRGWHRGRYFVPPGHVYYTSPVYYPPRPIVMYPEPVYYEPAPVYYQRPGLNITIPLR
jgi:hypothetical protein